jgi:hypothetical protein
MLAYGITEKSPVWGKNRLKLCISWLWPPYCGSLIHNSPVYEFLLVLKKNLNFRSKSTGVSLRFYIKITNLGKNRPKLHIFLLWLPYCGSLIHNSPVYEFLWILKKLKILLKIHSGLCFYRNRQFGDKNLPKLHISWSWPPYNGSLIHNGSIYVFLQVLKISNFCWKSIGVCLRFYRKSLV